MAAVAAGLLQTAQAGRAYIQPSCQERKHPLGPMQELGAFACGPPVELLPTHNRCRLSEKAVTGITLFRFGALGIKLSGLSPPSASLNPPLPVRVSLNTRDCELMVGFPGAVELSRWNDSSRTWF